MAQPLRLLIVDDAPEHGRMVEAFIRAGQAWADAEIRMAVSYAHAVAAFREQPSDLAFFHYRLGSYNSLELLRQIRRNGIYTPVVVLTSHGAEDIAVEAMKTGAAD